MGWGWSRWDRPGHSLEINVLPLENLLILVTLPHGADLSP